MFHKGCFSVKTSYLAVASEYKHFREKISSQDSVKQPFWITLDSLNRLSPWTTKAGREPDPHGHACWQSRWTAVCTAATAPRKGTALPCPQNTSWCWLSKCMCVLVSVLHNRAQGKDTRMRSLGGCLFGSLFAFTVIFLLPTMNCVLYLPSQPLQCLWTIWGYILHWHIKYTLFYPMFLLQNWSVWDEAGKTRPLWFPLILMCL